MIVARFSDLSASVQTNLLKPTTDRDDADHNPWYRTPADPLGVGYIVRSVCPSDPSASPKDADGIAQDSVPRADPWQ